MFEGEDLPLMHHTDDDDMLDVITPPRPAEQETPFTTPSAEIPSTSSAQSQELKRQKIQSLYRHLGVSVDPNLADLERFRLKTTGSQTIFRFMTSNGEWENLTNKRTGKWLADNTLKKILGGHSGMVRHLGLEDIPERFKRQKDAARRLNKSLPTDLEMESIPLDDLGRRVSDVDSELRKSFAELPMRDLLGLDKALQRIQGELANNVAKLSQVDHRIAHENEKLKTMDSSYTEEQREEVKKRLSKLQDERGARLELASQNQKDLQSQFARIRQTLEKIIESDTTLGEKIKTLFREQGITITAIIAAIGLVISTIVGFVTGGGGGGYTPSKPPSDKGGVKKWIQKQLKAIAGLLGKLATKLGDALPGILGSIVSWLLNLAKNVVSVFAEHTWLFIVFIGGAITTRLMTKIKTK